MHIIYKQLEKFHIIIVLLNIIGGESMKKRFITIPIAVVIVVCMITTSVLLRIKPDTSHISSAHKIAEYTKPAVVRILNYAIVTWTFHDTDNYEVVDFLKSFKTG